MRILADENISRELIAQLRDAGHDVESIYEVARGDDDPTILARARRESRVLLTWDTDFGELIFRDLLPPPAGVILLRFAQILGPIAEADLIGHIILARSDWEGAFSVVTEGRTRMQPFPDARR